MKHFFPKHTLHQKKHHNPISLFSITLLASGILSLGYLLYSCHIPDDKKDSFIHQAYAKESTGAKSISDAKFLSENTTHQINLPPYDDKFYYIRYKKNSSVQIFSKSASYKVIFYSQTGEKLSIPKKNNIYYPDKLQAKKPLSGERIFLNITNTFSDQCHIKVRFSCLSGKKEKKQKQITPKPKKNKNTSRKGKVVHHNTEISQKKNALPKKTPDKPMENAKTPEPTHSSNSKAVLHIPSHFLRLTPESRKNLSLSLGNSPLSLTDCTYFFSDTSVASIDGNTIIGKKAGITILYFKPKQRTAYSSCLIRIIKTRR